MRQKIDQEVLGNLVQKMTESYDIVGQSVSRVDGLKKLTGNALYAGDISFPGMLHLKILRSDRPHAKILGIRTDEAEKHPGVVAVFTYKDIPGVNRIGLQKDQPVLCDEKVRVVGDPVAMVAAETPESAEEAISLIRVDYEDLPGVFSPKTHCSQRLSRFTKQGTSYRNRPSSRETRIKE